VAWWWWVLLWVVLLSISAGVLFLLGRSLWRKAGLLLRELGEASDRLSAISEALEPAEPADTGSAVFTDPTQLRQERILAGRRRDGKHSANPANQLRVRSTTRPRQRVR
jgi:hypothetical protein